MRQAVSLFLIAILTSAVFATTHVRGYVKKNGTYVQSHNKTNPDRTRTNNYSSKGNVNPYTGKRGTKKATH